MRYPIFSHDDGTEVTASKPDINGKISLYVEKFDEEKDAFINVTFLLPEVVVISNNGYSETEVEEMKNDYLEIKEDIISYVKEKMGESA